MNEQKKTILALWVFTAFIAAVMFMPGLINAGDLDPSATPAPTMKTLDEIPPTWSQLIPGAERFETVLVAGPDAGIRDGVLDKETGLVWEKEPWGISVNWEDARDHCYELTIGTRKGWHLPTIEQLGASLVDATYPYPSPPPAPVLPSGHPFVGVNSGAYWSATTEADYPSLATTRAWRVHFADGTVAPYPKIYDGFVWCVRGGQSHDAY